MKPKCFKILFFAFLFLFNLSVQGQILRGKVTDKKENPLFAANVFLINNNIGTYTDFDGNFNIKLNNRLLKDTLLISFIGYKTQIIPLKSIDLNQILMIELKEEAFNMTEVTVVAKRSIAEEFSVQKIEKLDIYLNPVSNADALKMITALPISTNTDESANPNLRGSNSYRSRVILNGVPIYRPVRHSRINGIGNFSLFNTEIINNQLVYASNPPLIYGNSSAGIIEIETEEKINYNSLDISASLANIGFFLSKKFNNNNNFVQLYSNYQFPDAFIGLNKNSFEDLKSFSTQDAGLNVRFKFNQYSSFNLFSYFVNEKYSCINNEFSYPGNLKTDKIRNFNVINYKYLKSPNIFTINNGTNFSKTNYKFGNIRSINNNIQLYSSVNYKRVITYNVFTQAGITHDYSSVKCNNSNPVHYYALSPQSPTYQVDTTLIDHNLEGYVYGKWNITDNMILGGGLRSNIPTNNQKYHLSYQSSLRYKFWENHSILLAGGKYHSYNIPYYLSMNFDLLSAYQAALEYSFKTENTLFQLAGYYKKEEGSLRGDIDIWGLEIYLEQIFSEYFRIYFSNTFLNAEVNAEDIKYKAENDLNYFIKITLDYKNPKLVNIGINYIFRPGTYYTPIIDAKYNSPIDFYEPIYSTDINSQQLNRYNTLILTVNKVLSFERFNVILFAAANNLLNTKNEAYLIYNKDYSNFDYEHYQKLSIYFGAVFKFVL